MKIMFTNNLYNTYTETKNNKTKSKSSMTNNISFGGPAKKKAAKKLINDAKNILTKAESNINKVLVKKSEQNANNVVAEKLVKPTKLETKETYVDQYNNNVTLINPIYYKGELISCDRKEVTKTTLSSDGKTKTSEVQYFDNPNFYQNADKTNVIELLKANGEIKSCDSETNVIEIFDANGKRISQKTANYSNVEYYPNGNHKSWHSLINNSKMKNANGEEIRHTENSSNKKFNKDGYLISCKKEEFIDTKYDNTGKKIFKTHTTYNNIECYENGKYKSIGKKQVISDINKDANDKINTSDTITWTNLTFNELGEFECDSKLINKSTLNANGENIIVQTSYKKPKYNQDGKLISYETVNNKKNVKFYENKQISSCDKDITKEFKLNDNGKKVLITKIIEKPERYENGKYKSYRKYDVLEKKLNDNGKYELVKTSSAENASFNKNGSIISSDKEIIKFSDLNTNGDKTFKTETYEKTEYFDNGKYKSCKKLEKLEKKLKDNGEYRIVKSESVENAKFNKNGQLMSGDKEIIKEFKLNDNGKKILTTKIVEKPERDENGNYKSYRKYDILEKKLNDNRECELVKTFSAENTTFNNNGTIISCDKEIIEFPGLNTNGEKILTTKTFEKLEYFDDGKYKSCKKLETSTKKLNDNGEYELVKTDSVENAKFNKNGQLMSGDKEIYEFPGLNINGDKILTTKTFEKPKYFDNGDIISCEKFKISTKKLNDNGEYELAKTNSIENAKFNKNGQLMSGDKEICEFQGLNTNGDKTFKTETYEKPEYFDNGYVKSCEKLEISTKKLNDNGEYELVRTSSIENAKCNKNGQLISGDKKIAKYSGLNTNGDKILTTETYEKPEYFDNGYVISCEKFKISTKKLNDNGKYELVRTSSIENAKFNKNGQLMSGDKEIVQKTKQNANGEKILTTEIFKNPKFDANENLISYDKPDQNSVCKDDKAINISVSKETITT